MSTVLQNCRFFWFSFLVHRFRLISIVSCFFAFNSVQAGLQIYGLFIYGFNDYFYLRTHLLCFCAFVWGVQSLGRILGHFRFLWLYFALLSEKNDRNRTSDLSNHFVSLFVFQSVNDVAGIESLDPHWFNIILSMEERSGTLQTPSNWFFWVQGPIPWQASCRPKKQI